MFETLLQFDEWLFYWINNDWQNPVLDFVLPYWRDKKFWFPFYLLLLVFIIYRFKTKGIYLLLGLILCVGLADIVSSKVLKPSVKRVRPCNDPSMQDEVRLVVGCGKAYSFTSSHAANHFAIAGFLVFTLGWKFKSWKWWLFFWAGSIALGQVYVGVHFPLDVLGGTLIGLLLSYFLARLYKRFDWAIKPQQYDVA